MLLLGCVLAYRFGGLVVWIYCSALDRYAFILLVIVMFVEVLCYAYGCFGL